MSCSSCNGGLNTVVTLSLPPADQTDGPPTDVSALVAEKSVEITGSYGGQFILMGSHVADPSQFVPLLTFNSGNGVNSFKQTTDFTVRFMRVRRRAYFSEVSTISVAAQATCDCPS